MESTIITKNWASGDAPEVLEEIHRNEVNIALFNRLSQPWKTEVAKLLKKDFQLKSSGTPQTIVDTIAQFDELHDSPLLKADIKMLFNHFTQLIKSDTYRLFLATISNDMCRKFHTDINDLRMLCTYQGPGTLWLTEDNINYQATDDEQLVIDKSQVQQAQTGTVVVLKGAIYPQDGAKAILHRSPSITDSNEKRLLLRIDTEGFGGHF